MLQIYTANQLLNVTKNEENCNEILKSQVIKTKQILRELGRHVLSADDLLGVRNVIEEHTGIQHQLNHIEQLCKVFPFLTIEIAINGLGDSLVTEAILECYSILLLGTNYKDTPEFKKLLNRQAFAVYLVGDKV